MAVRNHTLILFIFGFSLFGCNTNLSISQQLTSYNVGCETKDVMKYTSLMVMSPGQLNVKERHILVLIMTQLAQSAMKFLNKI